MIRKEFWTEEPTRNIFFRRFCYTQKIIFRDYDKEEILPFAERSSSRIRMFTDKYYEWLKIIDCFRKYGLSIKEVTALIDMVGKEVDSLAGRLALFRSRKEAVERQMEELEEMHKLLKFKCWCYEQAILHGTEKRVRSLSIDKHPEEHRGVKQKVNHNT